MLMFVEQKTVILGLLELKPFIVHMLIEELPMVAEFIQQSEMRQKQQKKFMDDYQAWIDYDYDHVIEFAMAGIKELYFGTEKFTRGMNRIVLCPDKLRELIKDKKGENVDALNFFENSLPKLYPILREWPHDLYFHDDNFRDDFYKMLHDYMRFSIPQFQNADVTLRDLEKQARALSRQGEVSQIKGEALVNLCSQLKSILKGIEKENPFVDSESLNKCMQRYYHACENLCNSFFLDNQTIAEFEGWAKSTNTKYKSRLQTALSSNRIL